MGLRPDAWHADWSWSAGLARRSEGGWVARGSEARHKNCWERTAGPRHKPRGRRAPTHRASPRPDTDSAESAGPRHRERWPDTECAGPTQTALRPTQNPSAFFFLLKRTAAETRCSTVTGCPSSHVAFQVITYGCQGSRLESHKLNECQAFRRISAFSFQREKERRMKLPVVHFL